MHAHETRCKVCWAGVSMIARVSCGCEQGELSRDRGLERRRRADRGAGGETDVSDGKW